MQQMLRRSVLGRRGVRMRDDRGRLGAQRPECVASRPDTRAMQTTQSLADAGQTATTRMTAEREAAAPKAAEKADEQTRKHADDNADLTPSVTIITAVHVRWRPSAGLVDS